MGLVVNLINQKLDSKQNEMKIFTYFEINETSNVAVIDLFDDTRSKRNSSSTIRNSVVTACVVISKV